MASNEQTSTIEIVLSREELLFVLELLHARNLPGLDEDPEGELTGEPRALALRVARRALQARDLLRRRSNGEFALHNSLLRVVGVCAYAQSLVFAYHWASNSETPIRTFFHIRGNDGVIHTRPEPSLHRFTLVSVDEIRTRIAEACHLQPKSQQETVELSVTNQAFLTARQQVGAGDVQAARQSLVAGGVAPQAATLFASSLSGSSAISILQIVNRGGSSVQKRDITVVQNGSYGWIVEPQGPEDQGQLRIRSLQKEVFDSAIGL